MDSTITERAEIYKKLSELEPDFFAYSEWISQKDLKLNWRFETKGSRDVVISTYLSLNVFRQNLDALLGTVLDAAVARDWEIAMARGFEHDNNHVTIGRPWAVKIVGDSDAEHGFSHHENKAIAVALALIAAHSPQPKSKNIDFWKDVYANYPTD